MHIDYAHAMSAHSNRIDMRLLGSKAVVLKKKRSRLLVLKAQSHKGCWTPTRVLGIRAGTAAAIDLELVCVLRSEAWQVILDVRTIAHCTGTALHEYYTILHCTAKY